MNPSPPCLCRLPRVSLLKQGQTNPAAAAFVPEMGPDFSLDSTRPPIPRASAPGRCLRATRHSAPRPASETWADDATALLLYPEIGPDFSLGSTRPPIPRASAPGTTCATARSRFRAYCFPLATDLRVPHPSRLCRTRWVGSMNHPGAACLAPETPTPRHSQIRTTRKINPFQPAPNTLKSTSNLACQALRR
jgi:hypothetical protein